MNNNTPSIKFCELSNLWYAKHSIGVTYSYQCNLSAMIKHLNRYFGNLPIEDIKPLHIDNMIAELAIKNPTTKKPTSRKTLKELVHTVYRIFDMAIDNDLITKNPAKNSVIPKNSPKKIIKALSKDEQQLILHTQHRLQTAALIMMLTGLRKSEIIALKWECVDLKQKIINVKHHAVKVATNKYEIKPGTKNGKNRKVNIPDELCSYLYKEKSSSNNDLVFPKKNGDLQTPSSWDSAWRSYINTLNWEIYKKEFGKDNIPNRYDPKGYPKKMKIHAHQLRHTYATLLYFSGTDILTASKLMGHSSVQLTLDIYTHLDEEYKTLDISNFNHYIASVY